jgi:hypothetical protein
MSTVEIIMVSQAERTVTVRKMPQSQREVIDALLQYWTDNEVPFSITEVLRYEKPQRLFYAVLWLEGDDE